MNKLWEVFRFETAYQCRRPITWISIVVLSGMILQISIEGFSNNARDNGIFLNSPFLIEQLTLISAAMAWLVAATLTGDAAARDAQTRMAPMIYASPVSKLEYLGGKYLAAVLLCAAVQLPVQLTLIASTQLLATTDIVGPFNPWYYLVSYFLLAFLNSVIVCALFFAVAAVSRRAIAGYLGSIILFFQSIVCWQIVAKKFGQWELATLIDVTGLTGLAKYAAWATPRDKNSVSVVLSELMLNRAAWLAIAAVALGIAYSRFRFEHLSAGVRRGWRTGGDQPIAISSEAVAPAGRQLENPVVTIQASGFRTRCKQIASIALQSFREVAFGWGGLLLLALSASLVVLGPATLNHMGVPLLPTTRQMTGWVGNTGEILWLVVPLLTIYYTGELVWRERDAGVNDIADATPVPEWARFAGKYLGMAALFATYQSLLFAACLSIQMQLGYTNFELPLYFKILFGLQLTEHLAFVMLAFLLHVVMNNKYAAYMVSTAVLVFMNLPSVLGLEHRLLIFGSQPGWQYSDISGFGPFLPPAFWFKLYWMGWALLFAALINTLWIRGRENSVANRIKTLRRRLTRRAVAFTVTALMVAVGAGGFAFYNTNVLNAYEPASESTQRQVEYEQRYKRFVNVPQPQLLGIQLRVELYPERREASIDATYRLMNAGSTPIDSILLGTESEVETSSATFDRPVTQLLKDARLNFHIYRLQKSLAPGDSLQMSFKGRFAPRGFTNTLLDASVTTNGTFFEGGDWLPAFGYQVANELASPGQRKVAGLPPQKPIRSLDDTAARWDAINAKAVAFEAIIGTTKGQTAVAPGALKKRWSENDRAYFEYASDLPIRNDFAIYSAEFAVEEAHANDVQLQVFHHPTHTTGVAQILSSMRASLNVLSRSLGAYPYKQLRLVEHPGQGLTLHASPINISYEEEFPLMNAAADTRDIDFPFAIVAHEVAHQWWGNKLTPAPVEGSALLTESLAWYSALEVVRAVHGDAHAERILELMREQYLEPRERAGVPLLRASNSFDAYRRGPFSMTALREFIGAEQVDSALGRLMQKFGNGAMPLATSRDLYRELQAVTPDSLKYVLVDLFENNTFWELQTLAANSERLGPKQWRVTMKVRARKVVADTVGVSTEMPMNDLIEIGVLKNSANKDAAVPIYSRMHRVRSGEQEISVIVTEEPNSAGIDPRHLMIDTKVSDNVKNISPVPTKQKN